MGGFFRRLLCWIGFNRAAGIRPDLPAASPEMRSTPALRSIASGALLLAAVVLCAVPATSLAQETLEERPLLLEATPVVKIFFMIATCLVGDATVSTGDGSKQRYPQAKNAVLAHTSQIRTASVSCANASPVAIHSWPTYPS